MLILLLYLILLVRVHIVESEALSKTFENLVVDEANDKLFTAFKSDFGQKDASRADFDEKINDLKNHNQKYLDRKSHYSQRAYSWFLKGRETLCCKEKAKKEDLELVEKAKKEKTLKSVKKPGKGATQKPEDRVPDVLDWRTSLLTHMREVNASNCGDSILDTIVEAVEMAELKEKEDEMPIPLDVEKVQINLNESCSADSLIISIYDQLINLTKSSRVRVTDYVIVEPDEYQVENAIFKQGPVLATINSKYLQNYYDGVLDSECDKDAVADQAVLVVGYAISKKSKKKYWIVKCDWSYRFGSSGFAYIKRGDKTNNCGILSFVSYPKIEFA